METYKANNGQEFSLLTEEKSGGRTYWVIKFKNTGSVRKVLKENAKKGKVKDLYERTRYGVGYLGDCDKSVSYYKQAWQLWSNMIKRCYTDDPKGYKKWGTTVDPRWHCLEKFIEDLPKIKNFEKWVDGFKKGFPKYCLDKDLRIENSNTYSFETCSFVPESENKSEGAKTGLNKYYRSGYRKLTVRTNAPN